MTSTNSFDREFSVSQDVLEGLEAKPLNATPYDKTHADEVLEKAVSTSEKNLRIVLTPVEVKFIYELPEDK